MSIMKVRTTTPKAVSTTFSVTAQSSSPERSKAVPHRQTDAPPIGGGGSVGRATYLVSMPDGTLQRSYGKVFDQVAAEYDRHRPTYPEQLIGLACEIAGLERGDRVLEIGCGTGQLTRSLLARGLRVTAIEPGAQLAGLAQQRLQGTGELELVNARLEEARLPHEHFRAVFSASAIHWVDPDVGWQRAADALVPDGTLALIQYFGLHEPRSADDQQALLSAMTAIAPEIARSWPRYRSSKPPSRASASAARTSQRCGLGLVATSWHATTRPTCSTTWRSPRRRR